MERSSGTVHGGGISISARAADEESDEEDDGGEWTHGFGVCPACGGLVLGFVGGW